MIQLFPRSPVAAGIVFPMHPTADDYRRQSQAVCFQCVLTATGTLADISRRQLRSSGVEVKSIARGALLIDQGTLFCTFLQETLKLIHAFIEKR